MNYPKIISGGVPVATLNNITTNTLTKRANGYFEFDFECFEEEFKTEYIAFDNQVLVDDNTFDIAYIDIRHEENVRYSVKCEHVIYRLSEQNLDRYANSGTPASILTDILSGTDFTTGTVDFTTPVTFAVNQNVSNLAVLVSFVNSLGGIMTFSDDGFTVNILDQLGDTGAELRLRKNIKGINKRMDRRGDEKVAYDIDIVNIFESEEYKDLAFIEDVDIGYSLPVIDEVVGINTTQAVIEIRKDVIKDSMLSVTLANTFEVLADRVAFIQQQAVKRDDVTFGVKINNEVGLEIERYDQLARAVLNADEFRMQVGDGGGSYTDALYFDPINGKYFFVGDITITGGSGIDNLTDIGALATLDQVDTPQIVDLAISETKISGSAITAPKIAANAVIADKIAANAVVAGKINVGDLSAISADLGTINAGTINSVTINGATINIDDDINVGNVVNIGVNDTNVKDLRFTQGATTYGQVRAIPSSNLFLLQSVVSDMEIFANGNLEINADDIDINADNVRINGAPVGGGVQLTNDSPNDPVYMHVHADVVAFYTSANSSSSNFIGLCAYDET